MYFVVMLLMLPKLKLTGTTSLTPPTYTSEVTALSHCACATQPLLHLHQADYQ